MDRIPESSGIDPALSEEQSPNAATAEGLGAPFRRTGAKLPFFCVPGIGVGVASFQNLAKALGPDQPLYGLKAAGIDDGCSPHIRVEDLASHYLNQILAIQPTGPFHIGGYSHGGLAAFEIAQQLRAGGKTVGLLAMLDCRAPMSIFQGRGFIKCAKTHLSRWLKSDFRTKLTYVPGIIGRRLEIIGFRRGHKSPPHIADRSPTERDVLIEAHRVAEQRYRATPYAGGALLLRSAATAGAYPADPTLGWDQLIRGEIQVQDVPGDHVTMLVEPYVQVLAEKLAARLPATVPRPYSATA